MKLILKTDVKHLGYVGDVVEVKEGYARNCLLPQNLALLPTDGNVKAIAAAREKAAEQRRMRAEERKAAAERLAGTEITIRAAANAEGVLYGSVGPREVSAALKDEGHPIEPSHVQLHEPLKHLDNVLVDIKLADDISAQVKVWVVRSKGSEVDGDDAADGSDSPQLEGDSAGSEAGGHGDSADA